MFSCGILIDLKKATQLIILFYLARAHGIRRNETKQNKTKQNKNKFITHARVNDAGL